MHFGKAQVANYIMQIQDWIDEIIVSELKGLCYTCQHVESCAYRKNTTKKIIQCELYELDTDVRYANGSYEPDLAGLCKTCDHAPTCALPGRKSGVWHCNEYV
jgi:hypothetical protein